MSNKKKRRRRPAGSRPAEGPAERQVDERPTASRTQGASPVRRERKELVRQAREAERKRAARTRLIRQVITFSLVGIAALGVVWFIQRAAGTRPIPAYAVVKAKAAGCTGVTTPSSNPVRDHLASGATYTYDQKPATSGPHDPAPLQLLPHVETAPVQETSAVHSLEHGEILLYYRADGDGALPADVISSLADVANSSKNTKLAPYPDLPAGVSLALAAWNKLQTCPGTITADQAKSVAYGFEYAFACTGNAPESKAAAPSNGC
ncbi:MAG: DUF3105 domain-containing protein [Actinomycetota bacterium]|nr:DUF3105 domain-containing protein [Actinomycetota bacterium]